MGKLITVFAEPKVRKAYIYSFERKGIYVADLDAIIGMRKDEIEDKLPGGDGSFTINDFINHLTRAGASVGGLSFPALVSLEVTAKCNLSCPHCYVRRAVNSSGLEVPSSKWVELMRGLSGRAVMVEVSGGEPLLKAGIEDILRAAKRADLVVKIATNGTLLEDRLPILLKVLDREVDVIQVSIDGTERIHDSIRGKGSYRRALRGVAKAAKHFKVIISYTLMKVNLRAVTQAYRAVAEAGASLFKLALCRPVGHCVGLVGFSALFRELSRLLEIEREVGMPVFPRHTRGIPSSSIRKPTYTCPAAISALSIAHDGDAYPCIMFRPHLRLGNVFKDGGIDAVWHNAGDARKALLRDLTRTKCVGCPYSHTCMGGCPAATYHAYGTTSVRDPQCDL